MGEPYGSLVEFLSRYNCGGGFWWDRWEGFWNSPNGTNVRSAKPGYEIIVEVDKDQGLLGKFLREQNQSQVKDPLVQRKHFEIRKSF